MLLNWGNSQGLNALMNSAEFIAGFADKGSGEVDLVLSRGTGSATFTRATTATTVNSAGTIISVASGTPRSYYDPTTLQYLGYLSEGARTNLCLQSADLSAADWLIDGGTKTAGFATAPDGTLSAGRYVTVGVANLRQVITVTASTAYTFSFYAKNNGGTQASYRVYNISGGADIVSITSYFSSVNSSTFTRISVSFTTPVGCTSIGVYLNSGPSIDMLFWGAQLEAGSFASTYIPTTTASVPRNADVLTYPFAGNADTAVGTVYTELSTQWTSSPDALACMAVSFGGGNQTSPLQTTFTDGPTLIRMSDGTTNNVKTGLSSMATGVRKRASSWGGIGQLVTGDGLAAGAAVAFDGSYGTTGVGIGVDPATSGRQWFGTIRNVRIWQTQLSASQLQAVTS